MKDELIAIAAILAAPLIGAGLALAGSQGGLVFHGWSVMLLAVCGAFLIQWIVFVPAFLFKTEKFYDLTGSLTYISVVLFALAARPEADWRSYLIAFCVSAWALRLGYFLFRRVLRAGEDSRFSAIKQSFFRFLMAWTLQGLWVVFSLAAGLAALTSRLQVPLDLFALAGAALWTAGITIEAVADAQKSAFRRLEENKGSFMSTGLWAWSRHPNYFGEIVLWIGISLIAFPVLQGWQLVSLLSPVFVFILLTKISGITLLEDAADRKWSGQPEYELYKQQTPVLFPRRPRKS